MGLSRAGRQTVKGLPPAGLTFWIQRLFLPAVMLFLWILSSCANGGGAGTPAKAVDIVNIFVREDGLYAVDRESAKLAGLAIEDWTQSELSLTLGGTAVPFLLEGESLVFYGMAPTDRYSASRVYQLEAGQPGIRFPEATVTHSALPQTDQVSKSVHIEENHTYLAETGADGGDQWFWQRLGQGQKAPVTFNLDAPSDGEGRVRINLWGSTHNPQIDLDHDFDLYLNGSRLGTVRWEGQTRHQGELAIPSGLLKDGNNELLIDNEVSGASFLDIMELDWFELDYEALPKAINDSVHFKGDGNGLTLGGFSARPLLLDVSESSNPVRIRGWRWEDGQISVDAEEGVELLAVGPKGYRVPAAIEPKLESSLGDVTNRADFIIIAPADLTPAVEPLATAREAEGIRTIIAPAEEIYDSFGFGAATPESIGQFLQHAMREWQPPAPRYLLIVGDATSDYRDYMGNSPRYVIPSPMVPVEYGGETVSDGRMADVDGDLKADLAVGRWPVSDMQQVESLVERTLSYEKGTAAGGALFAVDEMEGRFAMIAERLASAGGQKESESEILIGADSQRFAEAWNGGAWLATYIGHGSVQQWGKDTLFSPDAVGKLQSDRPPIVLQLTCLTGLFAHPELASLSETMLLHHQGPVLLIAATSLTLSSHQEPFAAAIMERLADPAATRIGDAFLSAKNTLDVRGNDGLREINDTFVLLGDPSALIVRPSS